MASNETLKISAIGAYAPSIDTFTIIDTLAPTITASLEELGFPGGFYYFWEEVSAPIVTKGQLSAGNSFDMVNLVIADTSLSETENANVTWSIEEYSESENEQIIVDDPSFLEGQINGIFVNNTIEDFNFVPGSRYIAIGSTVPYVEGETLTLVSNLGHSIKIGFATIQELPDWDNPDPGEEVSPLIAEFLSQVDLGPITNQVLDFSPFNIRLNCIENTYEWKTASSSEWSLLLPGSSLTGETGLDGLCQLCACGGDPDPVPEIEVRLLSGFSTLDDDIVKVGYTIASINEAAGTSLLINPFYGKMRNVAENSGSEPVYSIVPSLTMLVTGATELPVVTCDFGGMPESSYSHGTPIIFKGSDKANPEDEDPIYIAYPTTPSMGPDDYIIIIGYLGVLDECSDYTTFPHQVPYHIAINIDIGEVDPIVVDFYTPYGELNTEPYIGKPSLNATMYWGDQNTAAYYAGYWPANICEGDEETSIETPPGPENIEEPQLPSWFEPRLVIPNFNTTLEGISVGPDYLYFYYFNGERYSLTTIGSEMSAVLGKGAYGLFLNVDPNTGFRCIQMGQLGCARDTVFGLNWAASSYAVNSNNNKVRIVTIIPWASQVTEQSQKGCITLGAGFRTFSYPNQGGGSTTILVGAYLFFKAGKVYIRSYSTVEQFRPYEETFAEFDIDLIGKSTQIAVVQNELLERVEFYLDGEFLYSVPHQASQYDLGLLAIYANIDICPLEYWYGDVMGADITDFSQFNETMPVLTCDTVDITLKVNEASYGRGYAGGHNEEFVIGGGSKTVIQPSQQINLGAPLTTLGAPLPTINKPYEQEFAHTYSITSEGEEGINSNKGGLYVPVGYKLKDIPSNRQLAGAAISLSASICTNKRPFSRSNLHIADEMYPIKSRISYIGEYNSKLGSNVNLTNLDIINKPVFSDITPIFANYPWDINRNKDRDTLEMHSIALPLVLSGNSNKTAQELHDSEFKHLCFNFWPSSFSLPTDEEELRQIKFDLKIAQAYMSYAKVGKMENIIAPPPALGFSCPTKNLDLYRYWSHQFSDRANPLDRVVWGNTQTQDILEGPIIYEADRFLNASIHDNTVYLTNDWEQLSRTPGKIAGSVRIVNILSGFFAEYDESNGWQYSEAFYSVSLFRGIEGAENYPDSITIERRYLYNPDELIEQVVLYKQDWTTDALFGQDSEDYECVTYVSKQVFSASLTFYEMFPIIGTIAPEIPGRVFTPDPNGEGYTLEVLPVPIDEISILLTPEE